MSCMEIRDGGYLVMDIHSGEARHGKKLTQVGYLYWQRPSNPASQVICDSNQCTPHYKPAHSMVNIAILCSVNIAEHDSERATKCSSGTAPTPANQTAS